MPSHSHHRLAALLAFAFASAASFAAGTVVNHPTGAHGLLMIDKLGGHIRFFDPATDQELNDYAASDQPEMRPHEIAVSPDNRTAYVTVYGAGVFGNNPRPGHTILVVDLAARKIVGNIDVAPYRAPHGIQVDARGMLYVACDLDHKVLVVDPKRRRVEAAIDVDSMGHWIALATGVHKIYASSHGDKPFISVIDFKSRRLIDRIPVLTGTMGLAVSPDGSRLLAADAKEPFLHVVSTATDLEVGRVRIQGAAAALYKVFYSPDGRYVLTTLPNGQVNIIDAANMQGPQRIVNSLGNSVMGFAFSADGKTVLSGNHGEGTASRIDLATGTVIKTFAAGKGVETLAYY